MPDAAANHDLRLSLCVLGSGSSGNCSVLALRRGPLVEWAMLIDLGFSPRQTRLRMEAVGVSMDHVRAAVITHMDRDHCHDGWSTGTPVHVDVFAARKHLDIAFGYRLNRGHVHAFDDAFTLEPGVRLSPVMASHDSLGSAAFRIDAPSLPHAGELGFATDLGRPSDKLIKHLRGVDVLAIESNYCPQMQLASSRPESLKRRIMGGRGHLSNHQSRQAIDAILPGHHVVLLHLSQECNDPRVVAPLHHGADYTLTITNQHEPSPWIDVTKSVRSKVIVQHSLFSSV